MVKARRSASTLIPRARALPCGVNLSRSAIPSAMTTTMTSAKVCGLGAAHVRARYASCGRRVQLDVCAVVDALTGGLVGSVVGAEPVSYASYACNADGGVVATYYLKDDDTCSGESARTAVVGTSGVCTVTDDGYILVSCDGEVATFSSFAEWGCAPEVALPGSYPLPICGPECDEPDDDTECEGVWAWSSLRVMRKESAAGYIARWCTH